MASEEKPQPQESELRLRKPKEPEEPSKSQSESLPPKEHEEVTTDHLYYSKKLMELFSRILFFLVLCPFICGVFAIVLHPASISSEQAFIYTLMISAGFLAFSSFLIIACVFGTELIVFTISEPIPEIPPPTQN